MAIIAMLLYRLAVRWFLARLDLDDNRTPLQRLWSIKMSLGLIAFLISGASGNISYHASKSHGYQNQGPDFWDTLILFAPLLLAIGIYKFGVYLAKRRLGISLSSTSRNKSDANERIAPITRATIHR
jgi:hypothetical protein